MFCLTTCFEFLKSIGLMAVRKGAFKGAFKGSEPLVEVSDWFPSTSIRYKFLHSSLAHLCHEMTTEIAPYLIWFLTQLIDATVSLKTGIEECHKFCFLWYIFLTNSDRKTSEKFHIYCFYCTLTSVACSKVHFITNNQNLWSFVSFLVFFWVLGNLGSTNVCCNIVNVSWSNTVDLNEVVK